MFGRFLTIVVIDLRANLVTTFDARRSVPLMVAKLLKVLFSAIKIHIKSFSAIRIDCVLSLNLWI